MVLSTGTVIEYLVLEGPRPSVLSWSVIVSNYAITVSILLRALAMSLHLALRPPHLGRPDVR